MDQRHTDNAAEGTADEVLARVGLDLPKGKPAFLCGHSFWFLDLELRFRHNATQSKEKK